MRVKKVCGSGTNGVGGGIRGVGMRWCKHRVCWKGRRKEGIGRNWDGRIIILMALVGLNQYEVFSVVLAKLTMYNWSRDSIDILLDAAGYFVSP